VTSAPKASRILVSTLAVATAVLPWGGPGCIPGELELARDAGADRSDAALDGPKDVDADSLAQVDCHLECGEVCLGANPVVECDTCVDAVCAERSAKIDSAPNVAALDKCSQGCQDYACYQACCKGREQACDAYTLLDGCACGYYVGGCTAQCTDMCGGSLPGVGCEECLKNTACAIGWYDWKYHATTGGLVACESCQDAGCESNCCSAHAASCTLLDALRKCACAGS
jgi:hypothetical protein